MYSKVCRKAFGIQTLLWVLYLILLLGRTGNASLLDYIWGTSQENVNSRTKIGELTYVKIPFEVTTEDEKFLEEAKKYTSLKLSDLDSCQHHLVMKIRNSCAELTEEELSKLSVNLLNCQSAVEGRQQFPCTNSMSLRECTSTMDSDMWNTYHLMNNRARAVCYAARHQQFRALSEMTVNKLMDSAHNQLNSMNLLKEGQEKLESLTTNTMESVTAGHQSLMEQQEKLRVTQRNIQDFVTLNLRELTREKALIAAGHRELAKMTENIKKKIDDASEDLINQSQERRENHKQILDDLSVINEQAKLIWDNIDHSTQQILAQHISAAAQYESTLHKLAQINATVNFLLEILEKTRHELDERLGWLTTLLGGTGNQLERLYSCVLHIVFLIVGMITASFVRAPTVTRVFLLLVVPLNLVVIYHHGESAALDFPSITMLLLLSTIVHWLIHAVLHFWKPKPSGPLYALQGSTPQTIKNGMPSVPSSVKPVEPVITGKLWNVIKEQLKTLNAVIAKWTSMSKDEHDRSCHTPISQKDPDDESSDTDDVDAQHELSKGLAYSRYGSSDFLRARSGTPTLRQRSNTPQYYKSPPTPSHTSSRSGTPTQPGTPRRVCRAICRNGQPCRNAAAFNSDVCRKHDLSLSDY